MELARKLEESRVLVIVRGIYGEELVDLAWAMYRGGIRFIEATFPQAERNCVELGQSAIRLLCRQLPSDMYIGAGTVLSEDQVNAAYEAGARYIISPNVNEKVIKRTKELGLMSIPGAMTPSEILNAHDMGADFVKIFPFIDLGLEYIKNIRAPISHVKMLATGGVNENNFEAVLKVGFVGAGISGRLTDKKLIAAGDFAELQRRAAAFSEIAGRV